MADQKFSDWLIALPYLSDGLHIPTDDIIITNGALEALNLCLMAMTRPGDAVLVESPTFYAALQSIERNGLHAIEVPTHPREGVDLAPTERAIALHQPKACWLMTNFQNPLGSLNSFRARDPCRTGSDVFGATGIRSLPAHRNGAIYKSPKRMPNSTRIAR